MMLYFLSFVWFEKITFHVFVYIQAETALQVTKTHQLGIQFSVIYLAEKVLKQ